jgi:tRNA-splicing ligase RtcB
MKTVISEKIPVKIWAKTIDEETMTQAINLANLPFAHHHIALMPDAHVGYGMPIGGVVATRDVVIPNAVGVDIGCGVCTVQTSIRKLTVPELKKLTAKIKSTIPLGFKHLKQPKPESLMPELLSAISAKTYPVIFREFEKGRHQLGTLGGGNHFIEIQKDHEGYIWLMIHSGSRNIGYQVARHYNRLAADFNKNHGNRVPPKWQLDYLPTDSKNGENYLREMDFCVRFASASRKDMMNTVGKIINDFDPGASFTPLLDIAHNYAVEEHHFGEKVMVHRKGATLAAKGTTGIIPGSQGSSSFIVRGLGHEESFHSCSHGAGRKLGRKQAQKRLDLKEEIAKLESRGIVHSIRHKKDLDEAAGAYKDIDEVMDSQQDLVEVVTRLQPLAVVKG